MDGIFKRDLIVTPDYCGASGALSPLAAFTIFQGIAAQHAEVLGVGSSAMAEKGEFWLTVHTRVDLFERAYLMDELTVRTWAESCSERDVRTYRSYTLTRGETVIARGSHMNNVAYVRLLLDCFTAKELASGDIRSVELHYSTPCFEGEELTVYKKAEGGCCRIGIVKPDGRTASQACVTFRK